MAAKFILCIIYHQPHRSLPIGNPGSNMTLQSEVRVSRAQHIAFFCPSVCELMSVIHVPAFLVMKKQKTKQRLDENLPM